MGSSNPPSPCLHIPSIGTRSYIQVTQNESKNGCPPADPSHRCAGVNQRFPCCQPWWGQGLADAPLARQPRQFGWLTSLFGGSGSGSGSGSRGRLLSASESIRLYGAPASCHPAHNCLARGQDSDSCCRGYRSCKVCRPIKEGNVKF